MSLYLKYRPQNFNSVVGQKHAITTIQNACKHDSLTHAYLFSGPRGTGKTSLARIVAKALNCLNPSSDANPCNECDICQSINNGRLVDLIEIDAASNRGIDEIRELREKIVFSPTQAKTKVYIIDEVHMLTKEAFNALLKTLEEPPQHAYFILATTESHKIPETIISRCQQFNFKRIEIEDIVIRLNHIAEQEDVKADDDALRLIAKIANGGLRDAIGLFEQMIIDGQVKYDRVAENLGLSESVYIEKFFQYIIQRKALKAIELINQINAQGNSIQQFVSELMGFLREQMLINLDSSKEVKTIIGFIDIFSNAKLQIGQAIIPQLPLEIAIIRACEFDIAEDTIKGDLPIDKQEQKDKIKVKEKEIKNIKSETPKDSSQVKADSDNISGEFSLPEIRDNWQRVIDNIDTPFIRMSLMDSEPANFEDGVLLLKFNSSALLDKIEKSSNQDVVQKAFETVLGTKIKLKLEVKKINLNPVVKVDESNSEDGEHSVVDMAKEVFNITNK